MHGSVALVALAALFTPALGHMRLYDPVPFFKSGGNNSPLAADGSDYPCKAPGGNYDAQGANNVIAIGEQKQLVLQGGATHGGGSCQISLTTDLAPTKSSKWMVIKSIEGGCPVDSSGNAGNDASAISGTTFPYTIPDIPTGSYVLAWTWFNRIGNREMYMECAPIEVTAPKKKRYNPNPIVRRQTNFPDLYVANIAGLSTCTTTEGNDYKFPSGGEDVMQGSTSHPVEDLDAGCMGGSGGTTIEGSGSTDNGSGTDTPASPVVSAAPEASSAASEPSTPVSSSASFNDGQYNNPSPVVPSSAPGAFASDAAPVPSADPVVPGGSDTDTTATAAVPAIPASTGTAGGSTSGSCTPGTYECIDGNSFKICTMSGWSVPMQMSAGTKCTVGSSFSVEAARRSVVRRDMGLFQRYD